MSYKHSASYRYSMSKIYSLKMRMTTPTERKMAPKVANVKAVLEIVGIGRHCGRVYCLNLDYFNFSILSIIRLFSSGEMSILYLNLNY